MAGLADAPPISRRWLRSALVAGPLVFIAIGVLGAVRRRARFSAYPDGFAKPLIVVIELALMPTLTLILALLLAGAPQPRERASERRDAVRAVRRRAGRLGAVRADRATRTRCARSSRSTWSAAACSCCSAPSRAAARRAGIRRRPGAAGAADHRHRRRVLGHGARRRAAAAAASTSRARSRSRPTRRRPGRTPMRPALDAGMRRSTAHDDDARRTAAGAGGAGARSSACWPGWRSAAAMRSASRCSTLRRRPRHRAGHRRCVPALRAARWCTCWAAGRRRSASRCAPTACRW